MATEFSRTGARREGDDYQDVIALEKIIEMIEHPDRIAWIEIEDDEAGSLDDVTVFRADGTQEYLQVKFAASPEESNLSWDWLLKQKKGKKDKLLPSLLQKWAGSLNGIRNSGSVIRSAALVTNRVPDTLFNAALSPLNKVDFERVGVEETQATIVEQLGGLDKADEFFKVFQFRSDQPEPSLYKQTIQARFAQRGGTSEGWLNLCQEVREWAKHRNLPEPDGRITLDVARRASKWHDLTSFDEEFKVPDDFVLSSEAFHEDVLSRLSQLDRTCIVITGTPGVGKSTYLSNLYRKLRDSGTPVLRHHYFLSLQERTPRRRFDSALVAESLMSDLLREYPASVSNSGTRNPNARELPQWLEEAGKSLSDHGKRLVVILDGMDHIWREQQSMAELQSLLDLLLPCPKGVALVLGTQRLDDTEIPTSLARVAPSESWLPLPRFDLTGVEKWLQNHGDALSSQRVGKVSDYEIERIVSALWEQSNGHPLHLHYTLQALRERGLQVNPENIRSLPPCAHENIETYYAELLRSLTVEGAEVLHLMAACAFPWPEAGLRECLDPTGTNITRVAAGLKETRHLLIQSSGLGLSPFHGSLRAFVAAQADHKTLYSAPLRQRTLDWLKSDHTHEYWRWAFEWVLESELGNPRALIDGPNRKWVCTTISKRYPLDQATDILSRSAYAALMTGDLVRALEVGALRDYLGNTFRLRDSLTSGLLCPLLLLGNDPFLWPRLSSQLHRLEDAELEAVIEFHSDKSARERCFEELNNRVRADASRRQRQTDPDAQSQRLVRAAVHSGTSMDRIVDFIRRMADTTNEARLEATLSAVLMADDNIDAIKSAINLVPSGELRERLFAGMILAAMRAGITVDDEVKAECDRITLEERQVRDEGIEMAPAPKPFIGLYHGIRKPTSFTFTETTLPFPADLLNLREHEHYRKSHLIIDLYQKSFFCFLANHLHGKETPNKEWLDNLDGHRWPIGFLGILNNISRQCVSAINAGQRIEFGAFYALASFHKHPVWIEDREFYEYGLRAEAALHHIALDTLQALAPGCDSAGIYKEDVETALESEYFHPSVWLGVYNANRARLLAPSALELLCDHFDQSLSRTIETFDKRSEQYLALAAMCSRHGHHVKAQHYVSLAAENLYTHGYHKDVLFFDVLEAAEVCQKTGSAKVRQWLTRVAPAVAEITNFTDGDETNGVPVFLGRLLASGTPELMVAYHNWLCDQGEYSDALHTFHSYLQNADFSTPTSKAIASTAIDKRSVAILVERMEQEKTDHLHSVVQSIENFLGESGIQRASAASKVKANDPAYREKVFPDPSAYPPGRIDEYINSVEDAYPSRVTEAYTRWFNYWKVTDHREEAYDVMVRLHENGVEIGSYGHLFDYALKFHGKDAAYQWLVKDMVYNSGWYHVLLRETRDETRLRWKKVKSHYSEKWFDFIVDTLKSNGPEPWRGMSGVTVFSKIVEYCVFMGQIQLAEQITERMVDTAMAFVSPLNLPEPEWVKGGQA